MESSGQVQSHAVRHLHLVESAGRGAADADIERGVGKVAVVGADAKALDVQRPRGRGQTRGKTTGAAKDHGNANRSGSLQDAVGFSRVNATREGARHEHSRVGSHFELTLERIVAAESERSGAKFEKLV